MPKLVQIRNVPDAVHRELKARAALAEALDAPLLTTDEKLARSPVHRARVEVVAPG